MKRWLLIIPLILLLAALALTVRGWLPPLLDFVGAKSELIQGLQAAVQIVLWLGIAVVALVSYLTGRRKPASPEEWEQRPVVIPQPQVRQETTGPGVQVGRDQVAQGDLIIGDKIGRQINTGGGAYFEGDLHDEQGEL